LFAGGVAFFFFFFFLERYTAVIFCSLGLWNNFSISITHSNTFTDSQYKFLITKNLVAAYYILYDCYISRLQTLLFEKHSLLVVLGLYLDLNKRVFFIQWFDDDDGESPN